MSNISPENYLAGYASNGVQITVPIATLPGLTDIEADYDVGDVRKVIYSLLKRLHSQFISLPIADRPKKFSITKSTPIGVDPNTIRQNYTLSFDLGTDEVDVTPE